MGFDSIQFPRTKKEAWRKCVCVCVCVCVSVCLSVRTALNVGSKSADLSRSNLIPMFSYKYKGWININDNSSIFII